MKRPTLHNRFLADAVVGGALWLGAALKFIFGWAIILGILAPIADFFGIGFYPLLGLVVSAIALVVFLDSNWLKQHKPCGHGVWAGSRGRCRSCQADAVRLEQQRKAVSLKWKQQNAIKQEASRLREREVQRLSKAWLSNTQTYLEMDPRRFENAVAELFRALGYDVRQTPFSNDGGKDAVAKKDGKKFLVECKKYGANKAVGRRDVQIFVAAMQDETADGGFYITTGTFARTAREYAAKNGIDIYDRVRLPLLVNQAYPVPTDISKADVLCLECGSLVSLAVADTPVSGTCVNGHSVTSNITKADLRIVSSTDIPYCDCGLPMRIVKGHGEQFWGCRRYPRCRGTKPFGPMVSETSPPTDVLQPPENMWCGGAR